MIDGNTVTFEVPEIMTPDGKKHTIKVERSAYAKGVEFYGKDGGQDVNLNIRTGSCKDNNGNENEFTATLSYGDKSYRGCAVAGAIEHAPT